jgi:7-cyano-7-deazaguanine synthase in queuosine biosynthesis
MPCAKVLEYVGVSRSDRGSSWRISFQVDDLPFNAFFKPPKQIEQETGARDVELLAIPLAIDIAAQVRPKSVRISCHDGLPRFSKLFHDATGALLAEQAAFWQRPDFLRCPELSGRWAARDNHNKRLRNNHVVLGFSGGKDSIVTLFSLLEAGYEVHPFLLNEGDRSWQDLRRWIPKLRAIGLKPAVAYFLSSRRKQIIETCGDWYFSSYQIGLLTGALSMYADKIGASKMALGIENSADDNFSYYRDRIVNHQHQKTTRHLRLLESAYRRLTNENIRVASPIASISDGDVLDILLRHVPRNMQAFSSCGSANWRSKNCGKCEKCAFIYALLQKTEKGRRLSRKIFKKELLDDVELYTPWLDRRYSSPLACVGQRQDVWGSFEHCLDNDSKFAVIGKWQTSGFREEYLRTAHEAKSKPSKLSSLEYPVLRAAKLVRKWADTRL